MPTLGLTKNRSDGCRRDSRDGDGGTGGAGIWISSFIAASAALGSTTTLAVPSNRTRRRTPPSRISTEATVIGRSLSSTEPSLFRGLAALTLRTQPRPRDISYKVAKRLAREVPVSNKTLYVISDLHIGGEYPSPNSDSAIHGGDKRSRGFRMCTRAEELSRFIDSLPQPGRGDGVELVINGDFLDFLAEERAVRSSVPPEAGWGPFIQDPSEAVRVFRRMADRDANLFRALRGFLAHGHALTLLLGNHDIELALPSVRRELELSLGSAGANLRFIYDGEAYVVGSILIEHGNRYDPWNVVQHDGLRRLRSTQSRREDRDAEFDAPAGSYLVARVMNEVKSRFPFVDLLKPENESVIPLLLALAPEYRQHVLQVASLLVSAYARSATYSIHRTTLGDVSGEASVEDGRGVVDAILSELMSPDESAEFVLSILGNERDTLRDAAGDISAEGASRPLWGFLQLLLAKESTSLTSRLRPLAAALGATRKCFDFDRSQEKPQYRDAAEKLISSGFKVVLFGHTHLAKDISIAGGRYLNTGTWANLIEFPAYLANSADHEALLQFASDMEQQRFESYLRFCPTYAHIEVEGDGTISSATLREWKSI